MAKSSSYIAGWCTTRPRAAQCRPRAARRGSLGGSTCLCRFIIAPATPDSPSSQPQNPARRGFSWLLPEAIENGDLRRTVLGTECVVKTIMSIGYDHTRCSAGRSAKQRRGNGMGWASAYIEKLRRGEPVSFRPRGHSMSERSTPGSFARLSLSILPQCTSAISFSAKSTAANIST